MDESSPVSRNNVKNEPSHLQSILRYFEGSIPIPCGATILTIPFDPAVGVGGPTCAARRTICLGSEAREATWQA